MKTCLDEVIDILNGKNEDVNIVAMPDFFLDRLITFQQAPSNFVSTFNDIANRKGGSIDGVPQKDIRGGNAANTTSALASLGVKVTPIICTSKFGKQLLDFYLKPLRVDLSHVKVMGQASVTTALELVVDGGKVNVMIRDLGALANFGPNTLSEADYDVLKTADFVCVFNWAGTRKYGTELTQKTFETVKLGGKGRTYCDTADPLPNREKIPELIEKVLKTEKVDVLSVNENESVTYAAYVKGEAYPDVGKVRLGELALDSARFLAKHLSARIDLHTTAFSAAFTAKSEVIVPAFKIDPLRATGAGDSWNAGNLFGYVNGLSDECRLTLANAVSACYLTDLDGAHPTPEQLALFLSKQKT
jgi:sugar/nucleoside kinase (ribokinase family)